MGFEGEDAGNQTVNSLRSCGQGGADGQVVVDGFGHGGVLPGGWRAAVSIVRGGVVILCSGKWMDLRGLGRMRVDWKWGERRDCGV